MSMTIHTGEIPWPPPARVEREDGCTFVVARWPDGSCEQHVLDANGGVIVSVPVVGPMLVQPDPAKRSF
jgi:hypothetical protein